MIQFFEMLNGCSPLRTLAYLLSILAFTFIMFVGIADIIKSLTSCGNKRKETEEETNNVNNE